MAFIGLFFLFAFIGVLMVIFVLMLVFYIAAFLQKRAGNRTGNRKKKILGNVFLGLGLLFTLPLVGIAGFIGFHHLFDSIVLPNEETVYVLDSRVDRLQELLELTEEDATKKIDRLLEQEPHLIHYHDANHDGILDYGLNAGNAELVEIALAHGAVFDDARKFEHRAYVEGSMDEYLGNLMTRPATEGDVEIIRAMFEHGASSKLKITDNEVYSNVFGKAVWAVLYNDETVTDGELEFLQVLIENNYASDNVLVLYEDKPSNVSFGNVHQNVRRDENYQRVMDLIG